MGLPWTTTHSRLLGLDKKFLPDDILSGVDLVLRELFVQLMRLRNPQFIHQRRDDDISNLLYKGVPFSSTEAERPLLGGEREQPYWGYCQLTSRRRVHLFDFIYTEKNYQMNQRCLTKFGMQTSYLSLDCIGGLHCSHVGGQNERKFVHKVCIKREVNSQRGKILLLLSTNMDAIK